LAGICRTSTTLSSAAISARRTIPVKFLEPILVELKSDGLVRGQRGRSRGYQLARSAEDISFGIVVRLMKGPLALLASVSKTQYRRLRQLTGRFDLPSHREVDWDSVGLQVCPVNPRSNTIQLMTEQRHEVSLKLIEVPYHLQATLTCRFVSYVLDRKH
jgi:hypothetical protein